MLPEHDGLKENWRISAASTLNPPYGLDRKRGTGIKNWLYRCAQAGKDFGSEVLALVPVATNTGHWKKYVFGKARAVCFLYDTRLKFLVNGRNGGKSPPMSCAMVYWGEDYERFFGLFIEHGAVVDLRPLHQKQIGNKGRHPELGAAVGVLKSVMRADYPGVIYHAVSRGTGPCQIPAATIPRLRSLVARV